jgi:hypothetical protein
MVAWGQFNEIIIKVIILQARQQMTNAVMHSDFNGIAFSETGPGTACMQGNEALC